MIHKVIGFTLAHSDNLLYIKKQIEAIKNSLPDLDIEQADETDSRLSHLRDTPSFPLYLVLKHNVYKRHKIGKYSDETIIDWIKNINGINA